MNSTSRSSRLVSSAARSPALAMTGPDVDLEIHAQFACATICASVVLPSPGEDRQTAHGPGPRRGCFAQLRRTPSDWPGPARWPVNSASTCGPRRVSVSKSLTARFGLLIMRSSLTALNSRRPSRISVALVAASSPGLSHRRTNGRTWPADCPNSPG